MARDARCHSPTASIPGRFLHRRHIEQALLGQALPRQWAPMAKTAVVIASCERSDSRGRGKTQRKRLPWRTRVDLSYSHQGKRGPREQSGTCSLRIRGLRDDSAQLGHDVEKRSEIRPTIAHRSLCDAVWQTRTRKPEHQHDHQSRYNNLETKLSQTIPKDQTKAKSIPKPSNQYMAGKTETNKAMQSKTFLANA